MKYRVNLELLDDDGSVVESYFHVSPPTQWSTEPKGYRFDLTEALADVLAFVLQAPSTFDEPCRTSTLYQMLEQTRTEARPLHELGDAHREWTARRNFEECFTLTIDRAKLTEEYPDDVKASATVPTTRGKGNSKRAK